MSCGQGNRLGTLRRRGAAGLTERAAVTALLLDRRERWTLTWTGRLLLLLASAASAIWLARGLGDFLSINSPAVGAQFLVVEGWMPSYAYRDAAQRFSQGGYRKIIAAGVAHDDADEQPDARTDFGVDDLVKAGVPRDRIELATASEKQLDRTFHSAEAVKRLLAEQGIHDTSLDILTVGPHARRSRLLYEKALGDNFKIGIIAVADRRFDHEHWWRSSEGVRTVVDETVAYLYARIYFSPTH